MRRILWILPLLFAVAGCGLIRGHASAPRNLENACSIVKERPKYLRAFKRAERRWDLPVHVQMATIHKESRFVSNARTPRRFFLGVIPLGRQSSARGYAQALDGTWDEYKNATGKRLARRTSIRASADFMGWYMNNTRRRAGISLNDARNQYLAYHEGLSGYRRGTHRKKRWLLNAADDVASRASRYRRQLARC